MPCPDENVLSAFALTRLADGDSETVREHLDACDVCRRIVSALAQRTNEGERDLLSAGEIDSLLKLAEGETFGRYVVLDLVGAGAMGVVYAAWDPQLERRVAIKLLRPDRDAEEASRLLREAQTMAKLSHPNVVPVYDVGTLDGRAFITMQFVARRTLGDWLTERQRTCDEILQAFLAAGEGLAAAHRAGIVHRDFKPANVLVDDGGIARVTDFGLARALGPGGAAPERNGRADGVSGGGAVSLTGTGAAVGTPAYMAPELFAGREATPLSDQFSFCVALFESLYGERPYAGASPEEVRRSASEGRIRELQPKLRVPGHLRRALIRGLAPLPDARWPDMTALLAELRRDPVRRRRRWGAAAGAVVGAAVIATVSVHAARAPLRACSDGEAKFAGIWNDEARKAIADAFDRTGSAASADAAARVEGALDAYAVSWAQMHKDACEATRVRGEQSEVLLDERMGCLARRLDEVASLGRLFAQADRDIVLKAAEAAGALTPVALCADVGALSERAPLPAAPDSRRHVTEVQRTLASITALQLAGKYRDAAAGLEPVLSAIEALPHRPTQAEVQLLAARVHESLGDHARAEALLRSAALAAEAGHADELAARARIALVHSVGAHQSRFADGHALLPAAAAAVERLGSPAELDGLLAYTTGQVQRLEAKYTEAAATLERALKLQQAVLPQTHPDVLRTLRALAGVHTAHYQYAKVLEVRRAILSVSEAALGPSHPEVATAVSEIGETLFHTGDSIGAADYFERARAVWALTFGPESLQVSRALYDLARVDQVQGRVAAAFEKHSQVLALRQKLLPPDDPLVASAHYQLGKTALSLDRSELALQHLQRAWELRSTKLGVEHPVTVMALVILGVAHGVAGEPEKGIEALERAMEIQSRTLGPDHGDIAISANHLGDLLAKMERYPRALAVYQRALAVDEKALGPDHSDLAFDLNGIGSVYMAMGRPHDAVAPLERAVKLRSKRSGIAEEYGTTELLLARALWDTKKDRARAIEMARAARDRCKAAKLPGESRCLADAERWLATHAQPSRK